MISQVVLLWVLASPSLADRPETCVIEAGPCVSVGDPRLLDPRCVFAPGACITVPWEEYEGASIIEEAEILVTPRCGSARSAADLEGKGREYLLGVQTLPVQMTVTVLPCSPRGFVDVKVRKVTHPSNAG